MSFWDDLTGKVSEGSKIVADKAKEVSEIANIRAQIVGCDNTIIKNYKELGKAYFEAHKADASSEFDDIMKIIIETQAKKDELNAKLLERKAAPAGDTSVAETVDNVVDDVVEKVEDITENISE